MSRVLSRNPATGETVFSAPASSPAGVTETVGRAVVAGARWRATPVADRAEVLRAFADRVDAAAADLAELVTRETGKRRAEADGEVEWTARSARWYADHPPAPERRAGALVRRQPLGVIAAVTPWNVPLVTPAWKWLPALVAGNAVVWKPSERASATAVRAVELFRAAGLPPDVLQLALGPAETAVALCADERVAGVHFTGSTRAGRALSALVAPRFARCALEMGGVNNAVVFPDADLAAAADAIVASATAINGQKCTSVRRVLVHEDAADELVARLSSGVSALVPGHPADASTTLGPLISPAARAHAERVVDDAVGRGGRVAARSPQPPAEDRGPGPTVSSHFRATVLTDLPLPDPLEAEEVFAPVLTVQRFRTAEEAWTLADRSGYGLAAAVHTDNPRLVAEAAARLPVGVLAVNRRSDAVDLEAPFGGRRASGNGLPEGGSFAYAAVTDLQAVYGMPACD